MTRLIFYTDAAVVPTTPSEDIQVLLYGSSAPYAHVGTVGAQAMEEAARLGMQPSNQAIDLLSVAMAVTAADTFVFRDDAPDAWSRDFEIVLPLVEPDRWNSFKPELEAALRFLSSDTWHFDFRSGGVPPPPLNRIQRNRRIVDPSQVDCASLFSGGLDSAIGAVELIAGGRRPLLVSHSARGDADAQERVLGHLETTCQRMAVNTYPTWPGADDDSMRTRSFQFLALGALAANSIAAFRNMTVDLFACENGFIALNPPLTPRRMGSHSTRTCHPYFLESFRAILAHLNIPVTLSNPYEHDTKGEMVARHRNRPQFEALAGATVSCGKWKRRNQQCGRCVPCLIRRASLYKGGVSDLTDYQYPDLRDVMNDEEGRDDLVAVQSAIVRGVPTHSWVLKAGPLPTQRASRDANFAVAARGLGELEDFLRAEGFRF